MFEVLLYDGFDYGKKKEEQRNYTKYFILKVHGSELARISHYTGQSPEMITGNINIANPIILSTYTIVIQQMDIKESAISNDIRLVFGKLEHKSMTPILTARLKEERPKVYSIDITPQSI